MSGSDVLELVVIAAFLVGAYVVGRCHGREKWATHAPIPAKPTDEMVEAAAVELTEGDLNLGYTAIGIKLGPDSWRARTRSALRVALNISAKESA